MAVPFLPFSHVKVSLLLLHLLICHLSCFLGSSSDELALLSFKSFITHDPYRGLASWGNHSLHFCQWYGVTCSKHKVTTLDLHALDLAGSMSPSLGNLTFLQRLYLSENLLSGPIPEELGLLSNLHHLNLSLNQLEGMIPHTLSQCVQLQTISLMNNSFHGEIPSNLSLCSNLQIIDFKNNFLSGIIPASLGVLNHLQQLLLYNNLLEAKDESDWAFLVALANCSNLQVLFLSTNRLGGAFPSSIGNLSSGLEILSVYANQITGSIPTSIYRLVNLRRLYLGGNLLEGTLPQDIGILHKLELLSLHDNQFSGAIPNSLGNMSSLSIFSISGNKLGGGIPKVFQNITSLTILGLSKNHFVGFVPQFLGSLIGLTELYLSENNLSESIPPSLGNLQSLNILSLRINNLEGFVPDSIWNLSSLQYLLLEQNNLYGVIPPYIGQTLPNLIYLLIYQNHFHGIIPNSLTNCSSLEQIDFSINGFTGKVPTNIGALTNLSGLTLDNNKLEARDSTDWAFIKSLANCSNLEVLLLHNNEFSGIFPSSIGNLSTNLSILSLALNKIDGTIPKEIKNLVGLSILDLEGMHLTGIIPPTMGSISSLQFLDLSYNEIYGEIPHTLGNLSRLTKVFLPYNNLSGRIPSTLGSCNKLEELNFKGNMLTGNIPNEITALFSLTIGLYLSNNFLVGPLPSNVGSMIHLVEFVVSNNKLSGEIPSSLGRCTQLQYLYMENNFFEGTIPLSLEALRGLEVIDLSHNKLVGEIPKYLETFSLQYLNLSFNHLEGEVPKNGIFSNASAFSVFGNKKLCGGIPELNLPSCFDKPMKKNQSKLVLVITVLSVAFFIILIVIFITWRNKIGKLSPSIWRLIKEQHVKVSYAELLKATNGFSTENLIGVGSLSSVYKGNMHHKGNNIVAVKVLNLQQFGASKSFEVECKALRIVRHRNLVKILTACSSIDYAGNDFKALVFEFMPNGSLEKWLHPQSNDGSNNRTYLNLLQRLNIVVDVACALDYLHNQGSMQIIHCDLKPSNVLLDEDMVAHVGDFGLAKLLTEATSESSQRSTESFALKGTIGYIAPVFNLQQHGASKSFEAECEALRSARHRNLVKVLTACSSIDYTGNDFKALVFEFMLNGSLEKWLHPRMNDDSSNVTYLNLIQRLNIAIDVACALDYLHNQGPTQIIHCDLKPSNVLLDEDMVAYVGDFGLSKLLIDATTKDALKSTGSISLKGTIGYVAPEYGLASQVSTKGDVYSFGILLLEIFIGRRPTDHIFMEGHSLHQFVQMALHKQDMSILDPIMFSQQGDVEVGNGIQHINNINKHELECIIYVLNVGLLCSKESPHERIQIEQASKELHVIRDILKKVEQARHN